MSEYSVPKDGVFEEVRPELRERFRAYHKAHSGVFDTFLKMARQVKAAGRKRYSAWPICNVIRWNFDLKAGKMEESEYKKCRLNNAFIGLYARLAIYHHPDEFVGFFVIRPMK